MTDLRQNLFLWEFRQLVKCRDQDGFNAFRRWFLRNFPEVPVLPPRRGLN